MKSISLTSLLACVALLALGGCSSSQGVTVLFEQVHGLKKGDPVVWEQNRIGQVSDVRYTPEGRFEVAAQVAKNYRSALTDRCRFVISGEAQEKVLEMIRVREGGAPLPDGAVVQGSTSSELLGESLKGQMRNLLDDVNDLSGEWAGRLGRELDRLTEELGRAGDQARERLRREVLPEVRRQFEQLRRWLRERGRGDEAQPLERKLEALERA